MKLLKSSRQAKLGQYAEVAFLTLLLMSVSGLDLALGIPSKSRFSSTGGFGSLSHRHPGWAFMQALSACHSGHHE